MHVHTQHSTRGIYSIYSIILCCTLANIKEQTGQFFTRIALRPAAAAAECELLLN